MTRESRKVVACTCISPFGGFEKQFLPRPDVSLFAEVFNGFLAQVQEIKAAK